MYKIVVLSVLCLLLLKTPCSGQRFLIEGDTLSCFTEKQVTDMLIYRDSCQECFTQLKLNEMGIKILQGELKSLYAKTQTLTESSEICTLNYDNCYEDNQYLHRQIKKQTRQQNLERIGLGAGIGLLLMLLITK